MLQSLPILYAEHAFARKIKYDKKVSAILQKKSPVGADCVTGCYCRCRKNFNPCPEPALETCKPCKCTGSSINM